MRFTKYWAALFAGATLMAMSASAMADGVSQIKAFVAQVKTARGEFEQHQINHDSNGEPKSRQEASGTFEFARPGRFIWIYQKPYEQLLQADGEKLYVYDKDLKQVTERKLDASLGASPAAILFGSDDLEKNFVLKDLGARDGIDWVALTPRSKDTQFQRVAIGFKDGNLAAMELHDAFGNTTMLTFKNIQKNPHISLSHFKFVMPKGVDVIKG
ncbi:outer membrane lipoprotein chaperone LolA [Pandoraea sp.]|uniref:outer membrane lipoprotein chaperone LolA n=1 Tax=Pandoraea sp. TaxID=1883445 RepID=UPI0011FB2A25|nr:outer membrane lipoprotein chaperone LolA [Pandoraea sp.]TAL54475.1 MAG: outer membrane lipoprotein chaperone LolA [Pandoraea sp.]TAM17523.1 MAG: outer membrane lipoprotein chaperone LolA [Pandoraea sp.]